MPPNPNKLVTDLYKETRPLDVGLIVVRDSLEIVGERGALGQWTIGVWRFGDVNHLKADKGPKHFPKPLGEIHTTDKKYGPRSPMFVVQAIDIADRWLQDRGVQREFPVHYPFRPELKDKYLVNMLTVKSVKR